MRILSPAPSADGLNEAERARAAELYKAEVLSRESATLEETAERLVVRGVSDGLIRVGMDGVAFVATPPTPAGVSADGPEMHFWLSQMNRFRDLSVALELGCGQVAAQRALGIRLEEVPILEQLLAMDVARLLTLVARAEAPSAALDRARPLLASELIRRSTLSGAALWAIALSNVFSGPAWLDSTAEARIRRPTPRRAAWIVEMLAASVTGIPECLRTPNESQLADADRFLGTLRVRTLRVEAQPKGKRAGPLKTPWGAARGFAACFGLTLPKTERDARRRKK